MSDVTELLLILSGLYLLECVRSVAPASVGIRSLLPGRWLTTRPWRINPRLRRGFIPVAPWPPLGGLMVADELPFVPGPEGITLGTWSEAGWTRPAEDAIHPSWEQTARLRVAEHDLLLHDRPVLSFGTHRMARTVSLLLREGASDPQAAIDRFLDGRFALDDARARRRQWRRAGMPLVLACNALLLSLVATVALLFTAATITHWSAAAACVGTFWIATALLAGRTARLLPPECRPTPGRRIASWLWPLGLVRAHDELRMEIAGEMDPLTVAAARLPAEAARRLALGELARRRWPLSPAQPAEEPALVDEAWFRARLEARVSALVRSLGGDPEALPKAVQDGGSASWCPRCLAQFVHTGGECESCPGVPLQSFAQAAGRPPATAESPSPPGIG